MQILRGKYLNSSQGIAVRKVLVTAQFVLAIGLLTGTLAVFLQINHLKNSDLGFEAERTMVVRGARVYSSDYHNKIHAFREDILRNPQIEDFSVVTEVPGRQIYWDAGGIAPVGSDESKNYQIVGVDYHFANLFKVHFSAGRNFSPDFPSDSLGLILNQTAVKWMGFDSDRQAIGKQVNYWGIIYTIVGVIRDYHRQSPKADFEPHLYRLMLSGRGSRSMFAFKINGTNQALLDEIKNKYLEFFPGNAFEHFYLDDYYNQQYNSDFSLGKILGLFSILALFVSILGIMGLYSFVVSQRVREISVRSVLGASKTEILVLFGREFLRLIAIAFIISLPVLWWLIRKWLGGFASQMSLSPLLFILPLLLVAMAAISTITLRVRKALKVNPATNLRVE